MRFRSISLHLDLMGGMKSEEHFTVNNDSLDAFEITPDHHLSLIPLFSHARS
jgi:hypothetical protein